MFVKVHGKVQLKYNGGFFSREEEVLINTENIDLIDLTDKSIWMNNGIKIIEITDDLSRSRLHNWGIDYSL